VLAFSRESGLACIVDMGHTDVPLPAGTVVLSPRPVDGDTLGPDAAVWMAPC
jgi:alpha-glucosidase